jgi:hypothetical protein
MTTQRLDVIGQLLHLGSNAPLGAAQIHQQTPLRQQRRDFGQLPQDRTYRRRQDDHVRLAHPFGHVCGAPVDKATRQRYLN